MDQMELEDSKSVPTGTEISDTSTGNGSKDDQEAATKPESSNIRSSSNLSTPATSYSFATSATPCSLSNLPASMSRNAFAISASSTNNSSSRGLFGVKAPIIKPASFAGTSVDDKAVTKVFGTTFSTTNASSAMDTFGTSSITTSVSNSTSATGDTINWFLFKSPSTTSSFRSKTAPSTSQAFSSIIADPSTSSLSPRTSSSSNEADGSAASRNEIGASFTMHRSSPSIPDKNKMDWSSSRKNMCPVHISKRPEMKHMMKGKHFKKLHHQIHSLRSYLSSGGTTSDQVSDGKGIASNQNDELPTVEVVLPRGASDMQIQMRKILKRKLRQRRNIERRLMQRVLINSDSAGSFDHDLLETNVNKTNVTSELSTSDANSVASSTSSMNDLDDADVCFLKSILPDMKTLNDARKLQFKSHVMSKLTDLICEQKQDLDQSLSSEPKWPQGPSTSQQVFPLDVKPIVPSQETFP